MTRLLAPELDRMAPASPWQALSDGWFRLRDRVLSHPGFQRWAARFPLTRFIARRRASALFDLCAGFVYSQVLHAAVRLGVFTELTAGPLGAEELAPRIGLPLPATRRLLDAAVSLKLCQRRSSGRYGLGIHGASLIGNPAVAHMVEHHALLYRDLADPVALLRGDVDETALGHFWSYARKGSHPASPSSLLSSPPPSPSESPSASAARVAAYSTLMASSLSLLAADILEAYPVARHRVLLDVGGGEGVFVQAAAAHAPSLSLVLFDLPPVAARARDRLTGAGLAARVDVVGGDLFREPLPSGADLISLVRVIHDHDDAQALRILAAARRALAPGGALLLAEPMSGTTGAEPIGDAYFGFYLLAMGQGRPRTPRELIALLHQAGFPRVRSAATRRPMLTRLLVAHGA